MARTARSMSRDTLITFFACFGCQVETPDAPPLPNEPPFVIRIKKTPMLYGREWRELEATAALGRLVLGSFIPGFQYITFGQETASSGSLDTGGGDPPAGWFWAFIQQMKTNRRPTLCVSWYESRIEALGKAAEPFVISPGKDKEAVDGIRAVYEAMTAELIKQNESLADEATFFGHLLAWRCTGTITAKNLQKLNGAGHKVVEKEDGSTLRAFLELVNQPRVRKSEFSPVLAETVDPSSIMEEVIDIFNATDAHEADRLSDAKFENVLESRSALVATLTDPLSVFGPSPMLSLGATE